MVAISLRRRTGRPPIRPSDRRRRRSRYRPRRCAIHRRRTQSARTTGHARPPVPSRAGSPASGEPQDRSPSHRARSRDASAVLRAHELTSARVRPAAGSPFFGNQMDLSKECQNPGSRFDLGIWIASRVHASGAYEHCRVPFGRHRFVQLGPIVRAAADRRRIHHPQQTRHVVVR